MSTPHKKTIDLGTHQLKFESGKIARQADGAVLLSVNDTLILGTACTTPDPLEDVDFVPLRVDYIEKFSSAGKTVGGFFKREGRPTQREVLTCRLIDRPIRPLILEGYTHDTQIITQVLSYDETYSTEPFAICAASAALALSSVPLVHPVGAVRVGYIDGQFVVNPTLVEQKKSTLDLMLAGTEEAILMIEGFCELLTEAQVLEAIAVGHKAIQLICRGISEWQREIGKPKNLETLKRIPEELLSSLRSEFNDELKSALKIGDKKAREEAIAGIKTRAIEKFAGENPGQFPSFDVARGFKKISSEILRNAILETGTRSDGRSTTQIRPISIETKFLPRTHGSALFTRGETQSLAVCTLGGESMAQRYEDLVGEGVQRFYLQYSFPPFSVGEVGRLGSPGRREVGHGKLAERSLESILPSRDAFPYIIRLESNITESNGSSSMASVCGGCLAMMDAGVPIKAPVAGIAMGLILEGDRFAVLSDILGIEDALGDMDFKVAGTGEGITSFQMDIKIEGITLEIMKQALEQAREGRIHILKQMMAACPSVKELSSYAPKIAIVQINPSKIGIVVGPGGKQIRAIIEETGVDIDINDDGCVTISSSDAKAIKRAREIVVGLTAEVEIGKVYEGRVESIAAFGAFVEVLPGKVGLCHISEFSDTRIPSLEGIVKENDVIAVKVLGVDERGKIRLSRKALQDGAGAGAGTAAAGKR